MSAETAHWRAELAGQHGTRLGTRTWLSWPQEIPSISFPNTKALGIIADP